MWTDRQTDMMKLIIAFCNFASAPKNTMYMLAFPYVGPCHHGMALPQVADGGTASNMKGSCKCIE